jgi:transcriptional regulator with XRE-family HTH domain
LLIIVQQYVTLKEAGMQVEKFQLGAFLKKARDSQHLSTRDLAKRTKELGSDKSVTASQISKIENNKVSPGFQTLQRIAASLDLPLIVILDGSNANPDIVSVVSTHDVSQSLVHALHRAALVELLMYCQELTDEQVSAILGVAQSIRGFTRPMSGNEAPQE